MNTRVPTREKLATALELAGAPEQMIAKARAGEYDDYLSSQATPITVLVIDALTVGLPDIARRAREGEFDAQEWEAQEWAESPEGQETLTQVLRDVFGTEQ